MKITFTIMNDEGEEIEYSLPGRYEVCPRCNGEGTHVNPNIDEHGITQEEFDEDPEFKEDYMNGVYDIECCKCHGKRVIKVVDEEQLDKEQREIYERYLELERDRLEFEAECRNEIMMQERMGGCW